MADQEQDKVPSNDPPKIRLTPKPRGDGPPAPTISGGSNNPAIPSKVAEQSKAETVRLDSVITPSAPTATTSEDSLKPPTMKIRAAEEEGRGINPDEKLEALKKNTVRVQLEDIKKGDTQPLAGGAGLDEVKEQQDERKTSRIDLGDVLEGEDSDIFKRRTALLDASTFAPQLKATPPGMLTPTAGPKTIRIKQPDTTPTMLKKPAIAKIEETIVAPAAEIQSNKKSETARIDLPVEVADTQQPPTRRKTIRIKRPEGATTRTLVIARSGEGADAGGEKAKVQAEKGPGTLFAVLSAVAVLLTMTLLYVLSAQTIAVDLPFPGKL